MSARKVKILDMTPINTSNATNPLMHRWRFRFSTSFPARGVKQVGALFATPEAAYDEGHRILEAYLKQDPFGNMGEVCGVVEIDREQFQAVINTYHSNT